MAKEPGPIAYTPEEVIRILTAAKARGVATIKLQGFEAAFIANGRRPPQNEPKDEAEKPDGLCITCGAPTEEDWMKYCRDCYRPPGNSRYGRRSRR